MNEYLISSLEQQLKKDPKSRVFFRLAEELRKGEAYKRAIQVCREGLAVHPDYLPASICLGRCLQSLSLFDEAVSVFLGILEKAPDNSHALRGLGSICFDSERWEEALSYFEMLLIHEPNDESAQEKIDEIRMKRRAARISGPAGAPSALEDTEEFGFHEEDGEDEDNFETDADPDVEPSASEDTEEFGWHEADTDHEDEDNFETDADPDMEPSASEDTEEFGFHEEDTDHGAEDNLETDADLFPSEDSAESEWVDAEVGFGAGRNIDPEPAGAVYPPASPEPAAHEEDGEELHEDGEPLTFAEEPFEEETFAEEPFDEEPSSDSDSALLDPETAEDPWAATEEEEAVSQPAAPAAESDAAVSEPRSDFPEPGAEAMVQDEENPDGLPWEEVAQKSATPSSISSEFEASADEAGPKRPRSLKTAYEKLSYDQCLTLGLKHEKLEHYEESLKIYHLLAHKNPSDTAIRDHLERVRLLLERESKRDKKMRLLSNWLDKIKGVYYVW